MNAPWPPERRRYAQDPNAVLVLDRLRLGDRLQRTGRYFWLSRIPRQRVPAATVQSLAARGFLSGEAALTDLGAGLLAFYDAFQSGGRP